MVSAQRSAAWDDPTEVFTRVAQRKPRSCHRGSEPVRSWHKQSTCSADADVCVSYRALRRGGGSARGEEIRARVSGSAGIHPEGCRQHLHRRGRDAAAQSFSWAGDRGRASRLHVCCARLTRVHSTNGTCILR